MVNMTLSIPPELYTKLKQHSEINWSDLARHAFEDYLAKIEFADRLSAGSELSEEDALEIGELIKERVWKRHLQKRKG